MLLALVRKPRIAPRRRLGIVSRRRGLSRRRCHKLAGVVNWRTAKADGRDRRTERPRPTNGWGFSPHRASSSSWAAGSLAMSGG